MFNKNLGLYWLSQGVWDDIEQSFLTGLHRTRWPISLLITASPENTPGLRSSCVASRVLEWSTLLVLGQRKTKKSRLDSPPQQEKYL